MTQRADQDSVPAGLRRWFVIHFLADVLTAIPLFVAPHAVLEALGWGAVDPMATRLVAAALFGIGIQSLLGVRESRETFRAMLTLKVIWSAFATVGALWTQLDGGAPIGWAVVAIFGGFNVVWSCYRWQLRN